MNILRKLLLPVVPIYYLVTWLRNKLYDFGIKKSKSYDFPVIAVGNLSVGGTGKSPMVEYLIRLLKSEYLVATLSRGYKRETKGFYRVSISDSAKMVGDEPLQFKTKFKDIEVAVDGDRRNGIKNLMSHHPKPDIILLDDAYQHRKVKAGFYILLTAYGDVYCDDILLPTGNLRESRKGADRANIIVVTKCPKDISEDQMKMLEKKLKIKSHQNLFFTTIDYEDNIRNVISEKPIKEMLDVKFTLVTGIANPKPLIEYYKKLGLRFEHIAFPDHHNFTGDELKLLEQKKVIVTTEKDFVRLVSGLPEKNLWYQPIQVKFVTKENCFKEELLRFLN